MKNNYIRTAYLLCLFTTIFTVLKADAISRKSIVGKPSAVRTSFYMRKGSKQTPEAIEKIRLANIGKKYPLKVGRNRSRLFKEMGVGKWMSGRKLTEETKIKIGDAHRGKPFSGTIANWKGKKHLDSSKIKMSLSAKGKVLSLETRKKISQALKGSNSYLWCGGLTKINHSIRTGMEYRQWRKSVLKRDNYTCQICGVKNSDENGIYVRIEVDHIKPFSIHPELRFDINNGRTLCRNCHEKTDTYGGKLKKNKPK